MKSTVTKLLTASLLLWLPLVTGCDKASNPMAPDPAPAPALVDVTVNLVDLYAVADGDGIEGAGEFSYKLTIYDGTTMEVQGSQEIDTGNYHVINKSKVFRIEKNKPYNIVVSLTATEWDTDILGRTWADTRMDNLTDSQKHSNGSGTAGMNDGARSLVVGSGDCRLRLDYNITSRTVN